MYNQYDVPLPWPIESFQYQVVHRVRPPAEYYNTKQVYKGKTKDINNLKNSGKKKYYLGLSNPKTLKQFRMLNWKFDDL